MWPLDLSSFDSVQNFCRRAESELERLDVLLENAALLSISGSQMAEGYEIQVTTNVISTFLMALMLLPLMKKTAAKFNVEPVLTVVSSEGHIWVSSRLDPESTVRMLALLTAVTTGQLCRKEPAAYL